MKKQNRNLLIFFAIVFVVVTAFFLIFHSSKVSNPLSLGYIGSFDNTARTDYQSNYPSGIFNRDHTIVTEQVGCDRYEMELGTFTENINGGEYAVQMGRIVYGDDTWNSMKQQFGEVYLRFTNYPHKENYYNSTSGAFYQEYWNSYVIFEVLYKNRETGQYADYLLTAFSDGIMQSSPPMSEIPECNVDKCDIYYTIYRCARDFTPDVKYPIQDITLGYKSPTEEELPPVIIPSNDTTPLGNETIPPITTGESDVNVLFWIAGIILVLIVILTIVYYQFKGGRK